MPNVRLISKDGTLTARGYPGWIDVMDRILNCASLTDLDPMFQAIVMQHNAR